VSEAVGPPKEEVDLACVEAGSEKVVLDLWVAKHAEHVHGRLLLGYRALQAVTHKGAVAWGVDRDPEDLGP
jgi:hypothetical protein